MAFSTLWTRFVPDARPLKDVLRSLDPVRDAEVRKRLAAAMGRLVALLHRRGILWFTPMPRNVMVLGDPRDARLLVADTPASVETGRPVHGGALALVDLFLAAFSPSRRRDFTRSERLRWLHAYCDGERPLVRTLWQRLRSRHELHNELVRALTCCWFTYLLAPLRNHRGAASTLPRAI